MGFEVTNGAIIRAELLDSNDPYLMSNLLIAVDPPSRASFSPVIFGRQDSFAIKVLILHPEGVSPSVEPIGKIARTLPITHVTEHQGGGQPSFLAQVFSGSPFVQLVRLPTYALALVLILVLFVLCFILPFTFIGSAISERRRSQKVDRFRKTTDLELSDEDEFVFRSYVSHGSPYLRSLESVISEEAELTQVMSQVEKHAHVSQDGELLLRRELIHFGDATGSFRLQAALEMREAGFIEKADQGYIVKPNIRKTLREFLKFLAIVGE